MDRVDRERGARSSSFLHREVTTQPPEHLRVGAALAELSRRVGLIDEDWSTVQQMRDRTPVKPMSFDD